MHQTQFLKNNPPPKHWCILPVSPDVARTDCPACMDEMDVVCSLNGEPPIRVGKCPSCGHIAYIDRPSAAWWKQYYEVDWDLQGRTSGSLGKSEHHLVSRVISLATGRICEIGSGWGKALRTLRDAGLTDLIGVEPSAHRAAAIQADGFTVVPDISDVDGMASTIFSIHTFEHLVHPKLTFYHLQQRQVDGDYLLISVPNQYSEPLVNIVLFLPHLHSFTPASLIALAQQWNYGLVDASLTTEKEINMVFKKGLGKRDIPKELRFDGPVQMYVK